MSSAASGSESDTLLPSPPRSRKSSPLSFQTTEEIDQPDVPIRFASFTRSVKVRKWFLALVLPASLVLEIVHLLLIISTKRNVTTRGGAESLVMTGLLATDIAGVVLIVRLMVLVYPLLLRE